MQSGNTAGFFRQAYVPAMLWMSLSLLAGCSHTVKKTAPPAAAATVDIGIPACNAYLNSYLACHRAAHIFPPDTLQNHYQAMLSSLQQSAADPQVRPYLPGRCVVLRQQLEMSMQGRSCTAVSPSNTAPPPPGVSTSPMRPQG